MGCQTELFSWITTSDGDGKPAKRVTSENALGLRSASHEILPRPFVKWLGCKGHLLQQLMKHVTDAEPFNRYHEPFLGGGALFFNLAREGKLGENPPHLSDINKVLIDAYCGVGEDVEAVISFLREHEVNHSKPYYNSLRELSPELLAERAARLIYLSKTCFNGVYRENKNGGFNVPMGSYKNPTVCDEVNLRACAAVLQGVNTQARHFESIVDYVKPGDFVYLDPPYHGCFAAYYKDDFGDDSHRLLATVISDLTSQNVKILLSNACTPFIQQLYRAYHIHEIEVPRKVSGRNKGRGTVKELLIRNF